MPFMYHLTSAAMRLSTLPPSLNDDPSIYVPWSPTLVTDGINWIRSQVGFAFNIAIWIFVILTGFFLVFRIVSRFAQ